MIALFGFNRVEDFGKFIDILTELQIFFVNGWHLFGVFVLIYTLFIYIFLKGFGADA